MPARHHLAVTAQDGMVLELLVLVAAGRTWFPTVDAVAEPAPWAVRVSGVLRAGTVSLNRRAVLTACG